MKGQPGVKSRYPAVAAASLWLFFLTVVILDHYFDYLYGKLDERLANPGSWIGIIMFGSFVTMGALIASRTPRNPIGWMYLAIGILALWSDAGINYSSWTLVERPGSLPGGLFVAWVAGWAFYTVMGLVLMSLLLFPLGKLLSSRWRPVLWTAMFATIVPALGVALSEGPLEQTPFQDNPVGIPGPFPGLLKNLAFLLIPVFFASIASIVVRFRRSRGLERLQMKFFTFASALVAILWPIATIVDIVFKEGQGGWVLGAALTLLPIATGAAILRYRLYDIDRLINRTLVYSIVTGTLLACYVLLVLGFRAILDSLLGRSNVVIAFSTLLVAAFAHPLRAFVQKLVDRRFYRRRYDSQRVLEAFSARLRSELDLNTLTEHLLTATRTSMEPRTVSLWLAPHVMGQR